MICLKVTKDKVETVVADRVNSGEYKANLISIDFSDEYLGLTKKAVFTKIVKEEGEWIKTGNPVEVPIIDNECDIPAEMLKGTGSFILGVYAYSINEDDTLELRYSPKPKRLTVREGSYIPSAGDEEITPTQFEIYTAAMNKGLEKIDTAVNTFNAKMENGDFIGPQGPAGRDGTVEFDELTEEQKASLKGDKGDSGQGIPIGGVVGQVLVKNSDNDFDTVWKDIQSSENDDFEIVYWDGQSSTNNPDNITLFTDIIEKSKIKDIYILARNNGGSSKELQTMLVVFEIRKGLFDSIQDDIEYFSFNSPITYISNKYNTTDGAYVDWSYKYFTLMVYSDGDNVSVMSVDVLANGYSMLYRYLPTTNVLATNYNPTSIYQPANIKYVNDYVDEQVGNISAALATLTTVDETSTVTMMKAPRKSVKVTGTAEYIESEEVDIDGNSNSTNSTTY